MSASDHTNNGIPVGIGYDAKDRAKSLMELSSISVSQVSATTYINVPSVGGITEVSGMGDVCIGETPSGGQAMVWSAVPGCWVASTIPTGTAGGGGPFVTIATNTQLSANVVSNGLTITELTASTWGTSEAITTNITSIGTNSTNIGTNAATITELTASSWGVSSYITANEAAWNAGADVTELTASSWEYSGSINSVSAEVTELIASSWGISSYITANEGGWGGDTTELQASSWEYSGAIDSLESSGIDVSGLLGQLETSAIDSSFVLGQTYSQATANGVGIFWLSAFNLSQDLSSAYVSSIVTDLTASSWGISSYIIANEPSWGGVTDHGNLTGLADDDHPHYALSSTLGTDLGQRGNIGYVNFSEADGYSDRSGSDGEMIIVNDDSTGFVFLPSATFSNNDAIGGVLKASGTSTDSVNNSTVTLTWGSMIANTSIGSIVDGDITVSATGIYKVDCQVTVTGTNRVELITSASINGLEQAADVYHNYVMRDMDQNTGTVAFSTVFDMTVSDVLLIHAHGNVDSNTTSLKPVGTTVILTYLGPH